MSTFTREELATTMRAVGFPDAEIRTGVGVALAESGGRAEATNDTPGREYSVGPWQINLLAHPGVTEACARDLVCSTQYAFRLWSSQGWAPWSAFLNGTYRRFVEGAGTVTSAAAAAPAAAQRGVSDFLAERLGVARDSIVSAGISLAVSGVAIALVLYGLVSLARGAVRVRG